MSLDDSDADRDFRIKKPQQPTNEQLLKLIDLPPREMGPAHARLLLVPENPSRMADTVLRGIYLALLDDWWRQMTGIAGASSSREQVIQLMEALMAAQKKMEEVQHSAPSTRL